MNATRKVMSIALVATALIAFAIAGTAGAVVVPESYDYVGAVLTGLGGDPSRLRVADINDDDFDDIVQFTTDGRAYAWLGGKSAITYLGQWGTGFGGDMSRIALVDLEGDGDSDVLQLAPSGTVYAWRSQGTAAPTALGAVATGTGADAERITVKYTGLDAGLYQHAADGRLYRWFWSSGMSRFDYYGLAASGTGADSSRVRIIGNLIVQVAPDGSLYGWVYVGLSTPSEYLGRIATGLGDDISRIAVLADRAGGSTFSIVQLASNGSMYGWQIATDWRSTSYRGRIATGLGADVSRIRIAHVFDSQSCRIGFEDVVQLAASGSVYGWSGSGFNGIGNPTYKGLIATGVGADPDSILVGDFGGTYHRDFMQVTIAGVGYLWRSADGTSGDCLG